MNLAQNAGSAKLPKDVKSIPGMNSPPAPVRITVLFARSCSRRETKDTHSLEWHMNIENAILYCERLLIVNIQCCLVVSRHIHFETLIGDLVVKDDEQATGRRLDQPRTYVLRRYNAFDSLCNN